MKEPYYSRADVYYMAYLTCPTLHTLVRNLFNVSPGLQETEVSYKSFELF
jgi:hypothetical protein